MKFKNIMVSIILTMVMSPMVYAKGEQVDIDTLAIGALAITIVGGILLMIVGRSNGQTKEYQPPAFLILDKIIGLVLLVFVLYMVLPAL